MQYDPDRHHRRSIRLRGYDYATAGAYFVTVVVQGRACVLGAVVDGMMVANDAGRMVQAVWDNLPVHYPGVEIDAFVVMPNHVHGIVVLTGASDKPGRARGPAPTPIADISSPASRIEPNAVGAGPRARPGFDTATPISLPDVVQRFKSLTTARYRHGVRIAGWPLFSGRFWQRNYYEHVIRSDAALDRVRDYIVANPDHWPDDEENPDNPRARRIH